jgi:hypothetical protein
VRFSTKLNEKKRFVTNFEANFVANFLANFVANSLDQIPSWKQKFNKFVKKFAVIYETKS